MSNALDRALLSLEGLSVGDAFGQRFFSVSFSLIARRELPPPPWPWTDDTHMALSIVEVLRDHGRIQQDALARAFAVRFSQEPFRGYARGAASLLTRVSGGADWRQIAPSLFGEGSYGNGAAMRAAPIGGFFGGDPERAAREAQRSAVITHAHPEGQAGAMAVAAAAAIAARPEPPAGLQFLREAARFVPSSITREQVERSFEIAGDDLAAAVRQLGTGRRVSAQDTVPFCLWCAAHRLDDLAEALWWTAGGLGDCDTTCAIVGGIVALSAPVPRAWVERREPLPAGFQRA
ncbi:MAG: ADP-ribosylglycohydrolase family protein [Chloroflexia bacterium]|nr:ADP-ribosylglycohydrolase family protein [Chloroflexia bacterium]